MPSDDLAFQAGPGSPPRQGTAQLQAVHLANPATLTWRQQRERLRPSQEVCVLNRKSLKDMATVWAGHVSRTKYASCMLCHTELSWACANRAVRRGELSSLLSSEFKSNPTEIISLFSDCETWHWNTVLRVYLGRLTWIHRGPFSCYQCKCCTQVKRAGSVLSMLFIHFIPSVKQPCCGSKNPVCCIRLKACPCF